MILFILDLFSKNSKKEIQRPGDLAPHGARLVYGHDHGPKESIRAARHIFRQTKKIR